MGSDAQELIYQELKDHCEHMTRSNIPEETTFLFQDVIFSFVKKKLPAKKKKAALTAQNIGDNDPVSTNFYTKRKRTSGMIWIYRTKLELQFKQEERKQTLKFKKSQNAVSQCFETYDEENKSQNEIFEYLIMWLKDQTGCVNRDSLEAVISFFVQNCEVFNETPE